MSQTRVLFNWQPRRLGHDLGQRFRQRLMKAGWYTLPQLVNVRWPEINAGLMSEIKQWHHDEGALRIVFAVWSNIHPTEIRFPDGSLLPTRQGDVILIHNDEVEHRAPENQDGRWFVRTGLIIHTEQ